jgi:stearoyl-CoA desaturase (delta-9 desaturase)
MTASPSAPSRRAGVRARTSQVPPDDFDPEPRGTGARILIAVFVGLPFLALLAAVPLAWNWGLGWHDIVIGAIFFVVSGLGVTVGFHRYFTHRSFKAVRSVYIALAVAGTWVPRNSVGLELRIGL